MAATEPEQAAFGEMLREYREAAGLSQEALSARSRVSPDTISQWERGLVRRPRRSTLKLLADALGLDEAARTAFIAAAAAQPLSGATDADAAKPIVPPQPEPAAELARPRRRSLWRRSALVAAGLVVLVASGVTATVLAGAWRIGVPLEVGSVEIRAVPSDVAHCPDATVVVEGTISVLSGSGTVTYHWVHPNGDQGQDTFVQVPAGVQAVHASMRIAYVGRHASRGSAFLEVTAPSRVSSSPLTLSYVCP